MRQLLVVLTVVSLGLSACSGPSAGGTGEPSPPDYDGDGTVRFAVATAGPRDDGAYNQALVAQVEAISTREGYAVPLVVDSIDPASARSDLEAIASQGVDVIAIGSSSLVVGNEDLFLEYDEIFWYCNCGSSFRDTPGLMRSADSGAEIGISAGFATGLLLEESGGDEAVFLGCCGLDFEVESYRAFEFGLQLVDPGFTMTYVPTGTAPFDFENTVGAVEAYSNGRAAGSDAVYPFLGGAHEPVVRLAADDGVVTMTAGSSRGCERVDLEYDLEVKFDPGDYVAPVLDEIIDGSAVEGGSRRFSVGVDPEVGAELCDPTEEQSRRLAELHARIASGEFDEVIASILADAYGGEQGES